MTFGGFNRRGFGGVPWAWIWDPSVAETLTLSARLGKGETAGFWNAPIGWIGGAQGALTAEVEAQLYGQFSARFNIVVSP